MAEVKITITGEDKTGPAFKSAADAAKSAFDSVKNNALDSSGVVVSAFDQIKTSWVNLKSAWAELLAIYASGSYLLGASKDALAAETAFNKLKMQVENLGLAYDSLAPSIDAAVHKTAEYARVQDENVAGSLQQLIFLTGNLSGSMANLNLVYDLAYQKGISTEESATLIGKAMSGNVDMLGRYIPELHKLSKTLGENATDGQKTAYAMALLEEKTRGASDRMTEHEKQVQNVTKAYKDAHEGLGTWIIDLGDFIVSNTKAVAETAGFVSLMFTDGPNAALKMEIGMHQLEAAQKDATAAAVKNAAATEQTATAHKKSAAEIAAEIKATNDLALSLEKLSPVTASQESNDITKQSEFALKQLDEQHQQGLVSEQTYYDKRDTIISDAYSRQFDIESKEYDRIAAAQAKVDPAKEYPKWLDLEAALIAQNTKLKDLNFGFDISDLDSAYNHLKAIEDEQTRLLKKSQDIAAVGLHTEGLQIDTIDNPWDKQMAQMEKAYKDQKKATQDHIADAYNDQGKSLHDSWTLIAAYNNDLAQLEKTHAHDMIALENQIAMAKIQIVSTSIGQVGQLMMTGNRKEFQEGKLLAEAEAAVSGALAMVKAYASGGGGIYGIIAAAGIAAATAVQISNIEKQQYTGAAEGGYIFGGTPGVDSVPVLAMEGEVFIKKQAVDYYGADKLLSFNNMTAPRFADGGVVGSSTSDSSSNVVDLATYKEQKLQTEQLDATNTLVDAVTQNTVAVTKVADGLTKISGVLTSVATLFTGLTTSTTSLSYNSQNAALDNWNKAYSTAAHDFSSIYDLTDKLLIDTINKTNISAITAIIGGNTSISGQGIQLGYSNGSLQASSYATTETSGGLFSSNSYDTQTAALDASLTKLLDDTVTSIKDAAINAANVLGQATTGLDSTVMSLTNLDLSGLSNDDASKAVEDWMQSLGNAFADSITGLDALVQPGENSYDALIRLAGALQAVNDATTLFGGTVMATSLDSASAASSLVDLMGGLDAFNTATSNYESKMYSSGDQANMNAAAGYTEMSNALAAVGYAVPATSDQFKAIVNSLDLTTTAGQDAYAAFMSVTDGAAAFYDQAKAIADAATAMTNDLTVRSFTAAGDTTDASLYQLRLDQLAEIKKAEESGLYTTTQITDLETVQTQEWAKAVTDASAQVSAATQALVDSSKTALETMLDLQATLLNKWKSLSTTDSSLSPEAAYKAAQTSFADASKPENWANLSDAVDKLLSTSEAYNAHGSAYQTDYQNALDMLATAGGMSTDTTIDKVDEQITLLGAIKDAVDAGSSDTVNTLADQLGPNSTLQGLIATWSDATKTANDTAKIASASETMGKAYDTYASTITAAKSAYNAGGSLTDYQNTTSSALSTVDSAYDTANAAGVLDYVDSSGRTHYMTHTSGGIVGGGHAGGTSELASLAVTPTRTRTTDWAQSGIDWINSSEAISGAGSLNVSAQPIKWAVYDINKDNRLDQTDVSLLQSMINNPSTLPTYASGGLASGWSIVGEEGPELVNFTDPGQVYPAAQTRDILQGKASGGNIDVLIAKMTEQTTEIKALRQEVQELKKHAAAGVKVQSAGFQRTIELSEAQVNSTQSLGSKTRLAALQR